MNGVKILIIVVAACVAIAVVLEPYRASKSQLASAEGYYIIYESPTMKVMRISDTTTGWTEVDSHLSEGWRIAEMSSLSAHWFESPKGLYIILQKN